jgi:hypothetical protein
LIEYRGERRIAHIETRTRSASDVPVACSTTPSPSWTADAPPRRRPPPASRGTGTALFGLGRTPL